MSERMKTNIEFVMPTHWIDSINHPVGAAIQNLYTELAKAYLEHNAGTSLKDCRWAEWAEHYEDVEEGA